MRRRYTDRYFSSLSIMDDQSPTASMVTPVSKPTLSTNLDSSQQLIAFNVNAHTLLKLTATNYAAWRIQFNSLLFGYDLFGYVDGSTPCPPAKITQPNSDVSAPNPDYLFWFRQDQLLLNAIVGSLSPNFLHFLSTCTTSRDAWTALEKTYASPSRGRILTHRLNLANPQQGTQTIMDYMQDIKRNIDSLALMNVSVDFDELSLRIMNGLNPKYSKLSHALRVRETPVTFEELFEQLLNYEAQLNLPSNSSPPASSPATAFYGNNLSSSNQPRPKTNNRPRSGNNNNNRNHHNNNNRSPSHPQQTWQPRPPAPAPNNGGSRYLGKSHFVEFYQATNSSSLFNGS